MKGLFDCGMKSRECVSLLGAEAKLWILAAYELLHGYHLFLVVRGAFGSSHSMMSVAGNRTGLRLKKNAFSSMELSQSKFVMKTSILGKVPRLQ